MKLKILFFFLVLAAGLYIFQNKITSFYFQIFRELPKIERDVAQLADVRKEINTPPPLRAREDAPRSFLTTTGVVKWTNLKRQEFGLAVLSSNNQIQEAAIAKVEDMFAHQYFAHVAPDGRDAGVLAREAGYEYIAVGENLALGNYENDQVLVEAWMASPGHKENILSPRYTEIGVAVKRGTFEGKTTWLAVQIFGKPLSACQQPDENLKVAIVRNQQLLEDLESAIQTRRVEIEASDFSSRKEYNQRVEEHNRLVKEYNQLVEITKNLTQTYNRQVQAFNVCASQ